MLNYAICEIAGKQYKVLPNVPFETPNMEAKDIEVNVLLISDGDKIKIGTPYLKEKLDLKFIENTKGEKIRVSKYQPKANYRRVTGHRSKLAKFVLSVKNTVKNKA